MQWVVKMDGEGNSSLWDGYKQVKDEYLRGLLYVKQDSGELMREVRFGP